MACRNGLSIMVKWHCGAQWLPLGGKKFVGPLQGGHGDPQINWVETLKYVIHALIVRALAFVPHLLCVL